MSRHPHGSPASRARIACGQGITRGRTVVGWHFDDPQRFDRDGKFFEVSIDQAVYR